MMALLILFGINMGLFGSQSEADWSHRAISATIPYINILLINVAQAIIAIFLASEFLKKDRKLDTTEVIYARPVSNGEYVTGNVSQEYLDALEEARNDAAKSENRLSDETIGLHNDE